jgi:haloalkane dehalogenase
MLAVVGSRTATATLGTTRVVQRMTRSKMGVGRHFDRADRRAFFGPYRRRSFARNFHRAMRSARRSVELFATAETALTCTTPGLPVLTVFGEKNDPFGFADRWRSMFPGAMSWTVRGGNHFPMCDDPDGYVSHLRNWHRAHVAS